MNNSETTNHQTNDKDFIRLRPGVTIKVHQQIKEGNKTRIQIFEGMIIARKHGKGINGTITVRKISGGIGVERIFPLHLPTISRFEVVKTSKVRKAKLYYLRGKTARETKKKVKNISEAKTGQNGIENSSVATS